MWQLRNLSEFISSPPCRSVDRIAVICVMGDFAPYNSVSSRYRGGRDNSLDPDNKDDAEKGEDDQSDDEILALPFVGIGFNGDEGASKTEEEEAKPTPRELTDYNPHPGDGSDAAPSEARERGQSIGGVIAEKLDKCAIT